VPVIKGKIEKEEGDFLKVKHLELEILYKIRKSKICRRDGDIIEFNSEDIEESKDRKLPPDHPDSLPPDHPDSTNDNVIG
jgi:hypothetical protein